MATSLLPTAPVGIRACGISGDGKSDNHRRKRSASNWWTPLFGWSSDPDYIDAKSSDEVNRRVDTRSESYLDPRPAARSRLAPISFTEEKARKLRMLTMNTESFHDVMYHSAIASRLASDFSDRRS